MKYLNLKLFKEPEKPEFRVQKTTRINGDIFFTPHVLFYGYYGPLYSSTNNFDTEAEALKCIDTYKGMRILSRETVAYRE